MDPLLVLVEEGDVEGAGEVLAEVVARGRLQGAAVAHEGLAGEGLDGPGEALGGALDAGQDRDRGGLVVVVAVDAQHPQGLFAGLLRGSVDGVALLPEDLDGAQEGAGDLLPAHEIGPLVDQDRQVAGAVDSTPVESADYGLGGRPDGDPLLEV